MGFINKLFGGLFAFLGAIFGGLGKLLGFGKKSEYFLEAESSKEVKEPSAKKPAAAQANAKTAAPASLNGQVPEPAPVVAAAQPVAPVAAAPQTFAPNFLVSSGSNSRRRPGPSLNPFLDMAKQIKS